jgi:sulfide dehydrogenase cytochrome subunit
MFSLLRQTFAVVWLTAFVTPFGWAHSLPPAVANDCTGCHGFEGQSAGPSVPTIGGLSPSYFLRAMLGYKYGSDLAGYRAALARLGQKGDSSVVYERPTNIMDRIARGYTDEEIVIYSNYFAEHPFVPLQQAFDEEKAQIGAELHDDYCESCHKEGGRGGKNAGILKGQPKAYLHDVLLDFQYGLRDMSEDMLEEFDALDEEDVEALVQFYISPY